MNTDTKKEVKHYDTLEELMERVAKYNEEENGDKQQFPTIGMTAEDKKYIAKIIRDETGCGMMEATVAFETLIEAIKSAPHLPSDTGRKLNFSWELYNLRQDN